MKAGTKGEVSLLLQAEQEVDDIDEPTASFQGRCRKHAELHKVYVQ